MAEDTAAGDKEKVTGRWLLITLDVEVRASEIMLLDVLHHFAKREGRVPKWAWE